MAMILVVDDNQDVLDILQFWLSSRGHKPVLINEAKRAFAQIEKDKPDLVLMDMSMPDIPGYEIIDTIKANESTKSIPVIGLSAFDENDIRNLAKDVKMDDFIRKPFEFTLLENKINQYCSI